MSDGAAVVFISTRVRLSAMERAALAAVLAMFIGVLLAAWQWKVIDFPSLFGLFRHAQLLFWLLLAGLCFVFVFAVVAQHYLARARLILDSGSMRIEANAPAILSPLGFRSCSVAWSDLVAMVYLPEFGVIELRAKAQTAPALSIRVGGWCLQDPESVTTVIMRARELGEPDLVRVMRERGLLDAGLPEAG